MVFLALTGWLLTTLPLAVAVGKFLKHRNREPSV